MCFTAYGELKNGKCLLWSDNSQKYIHLHLKSWLGLELWCLTQLSTIFQVYRGSQFYWQRKLEYPEKTINCQTLSLQYVRVEHHVYILTIHTYSYNKNPTKSVNQYKADIIIIILGQKKCPLTCSKIIGSVGRKNIL